jgi:hypothetical protein
MPSLANYGAGAQLNVGTEPKNRPVPIAPVEEAFVGEDSVFPYRGMEQHGVEPHSHWEDVPIDKGDNEVEYDEPAPEPDPIPVKIVQESKDEFRDWNVRRDFAPSGIAARILQRNPHRTKATIKNIGTAIIYIGPEPFNNSQLGYPVAVNAEFSYDQQGDVWAMTDDPAQQSLAILQEYSVPA